MRRFNSKYFIGLFIQGFLTLILCGPNHLAAAAQEDVNVPGDQTTAAADTSDVQSGVSNDTEHYLYNPVGKTDPFKSFIVAREERKQSRARTYLETVELSQLDLVTIAISSKGSWAIVTDSKNMGYIIKEGTPIGTNNGVVSKITETEVVIKEEYQDFRGVMQSREIVKVSKSLQQVD